MMLLTATMGEYYYCYSLGQALVHAVGLTTGRPTQETQTALEICAKLIEFEQKKKEEGYWVRLAENLPRDAMALCNLYRRALAHNRLLSPVTTCEEDMCKHVVLTEVLAWYAQHPTRMTGYEQFSEAMGSLQRCLPPLPWVLHSNTSQANTSQAEEEEEEEKESQSEEKEEEEKEKEKRRRKRKKEKKEKKEKKQERKKRKTEEEGKKKEEEEEEEEEKRKKEEEEKKKRKKEEEKEEEEKEEGMVLLQKPVKRPNKKAKQVQVR